VGQAQRAEIHPVVLNWMTHIENNDRECKREKSAIHDILTLVREKLLVVPCRRIGRAIQVGAGGLQRLNLAKHSHGTGQTLFNFGTPSTISLQKLRRKVICSSKEIGRTCRCPGCGLASRPRPHHRPTLKREKRTSHQMCVYFNCAPPHWNS
jgi:hypothetical protein